MLKFLASSSLVLSLIWGVYGWVTYANSTHLVPAQTLPAPAADPVPAAKFPNPPDHVVIVIEENKDFTNIISSPLTGTEAKKREGIPYPYYINTLAKQGALFTNFHAEFHPSQPNYYALFTGLPPEAIQQQIQGDRCPQGFNGKQMNLGSALIAGKLTFAGYSQSLPMTSPEPPATPVPVQPTPCKKEAFAAKHSPWVYFDDLKAFNKSFSDFPSTPFDSLPTVSFVIPDMDNDMHNMPKGKDMAILKADIWLQEHLHDYVEWAMQHNSLLILTFDEDANDAAGYSEVMTNRIVTIFVGPMVKQGVQVDTTYNHYNLLRTLLDMYGLDANGMGVVDRYGAMTGFWIWEP